MTSPEQKAKKVFLSYLDDNNHRIATYVWLISLTDTSVTFRTHNNIIVLPMSRILKVKESLEEAITSSSQ